MPSASTITRSPSRVLAAVTLIALVLLVGPARPASAHAELISTSPVAGAVLDTAPQQIELVFSERVQISLGAIDLFDGTGKKIPLDDAGYAPGDERQVVVGLPPLGDGSYVVSWKVVSDDSHPISSAFTFQIGQTATLEEGVVGGVTAGTRANDAARNVLDVLRVVLIAGTVLLGGLLVVQAAGIVEWTTAHRRVAALGALAGGLAALLMIPVEIAYVDDRSIGSALTDVAAWRELLRTRIGTAWGLRAAALYVGGFALVATHREHRRGWWRAAVVALLAVLGVSYAYGGHGAAGRWLLVGIGATVVHVAAATTWIGGLVGLAIGARRLSEEGAKRWALLAAGAAALVVASGIVQGFRQLPTTDALWHSDYGKLLIVKVVLVAVVLGFAALGRRAIAGGGWTGLRRTIVPELLTAVGVIAITGSLMGANPNVAPASGGIFSQTLTSESYIASIAVDPARPGPSQLHLYLSSPGGALERPDSVTVTIADPAKGVAPLAVTMVGAGASHYQSSGLNIPYPATWTLRITALYNTFDEVTFTTEVPVR